MYCEENNRYCEDYFDRTSSIEHQQRFDFLQKWLEDNIEEHPIDDEHDTYFDCVDKIEDNCNLIEQQEFFKLNSSSHCSVLSIPYHPWISVIWLSVHRKTGIFRRCVNRLRRSTKPSLPNLAEEFARIYIGHFNHPIGFRFHLSYAKEKWLLILRQIKVINYPIYGNPRTRIILIRKGVAFLSR